MEEQVSAKELAVRAAVGRLTERELYAYKVFCDSRTPPLAPSTAGRMFEAYLQGQSCEDIMKLVPGIQLGQIVHARVVGDWDKKRDEHLERLLTTLRGRVEQAELETVDLFVNLIAASKKVIAEKVKRYLISGNEEDLKGVPVATSLKEWNALVQLMKESTGQNVKKVEGRMEHHVSYDPAPVPVNKPFSPDEAANAIEVMLVEEKKE